MTEMRKIQKPTGTAKEPYMRIPLEIGFNPGDLVVVEKVDEETATIKRVFKQKPMYEYTGPNLDDSIDNSGDD